MLGFWKILFRRLFVKDFEEFRELDRRMLGDGCYNFGVMGLRMIKGKILEGGIKIMRKRVMIIGML